MLVAGSTRRPRIPIQIAKAISALPITAETKIASIFTFIYLSSPGTDQKSRSPACFRSVTYKFLAAHLFFVHACRFQHLSHGVNKAR